jgi:hypothetical protein
MLRSVSKVQSSIYFVEICRRIQNTTIGSSVGSENLTTDVGAAVQMPAIKPPKT